MAGALSQDELEAAFDRAMPDSYLDPMKASPDGGYELAQGFAAVGARASLAVSRLDDDGYITTAQGPALATGTVSFYRTSDAAGAVTVLTGTLVRCTVGGQVFRTVADAAFGPTDLEVDGVPIISAGYGYEYNVPGQFVDPQGFVWPGPIDQVSMPLQSPPFGDPTILVRNPAPTTGGLPGSLDAILYGERSIKRQASESDKNYRARGRQLPDTVSPNAIARQLKSYFRPYVGLFWRVVETWTHGWQECWDAPLEGPSTYFAGADYDENLFCFDDPRDASPMRNRWLGENDYSAAFVVELGWMPAIVDFGFAFDDTSTAESDLEDALGERAFPAFDVPPTLAPPSLGPCFDGVDTGISDLVVNLFDLLDNIKGGGCYVAICMQELE